MVDYVYFIFTFYCLFQKLRKLCAVAFLRMQTGFRCSTQLHVSALEYKQCNLKEANSEDEEMYSPKSIEKY